MLAHHFNLEFKGRVITLDFKLAFPLNVMFLTFKISPILVKDFHKSGVFTRKAFNNSEFTMEL